MGTSYSQQKLSPLGAVYHGFFVSNENIEDSPPRAEWIGNAGICLHTGEQLCSLSQYRPGASIFVESLQYSKRRCSSSRSQRRITAVSTPKPDLINALPDECLQEVFKFLPQVQDRCACASVCMKWLMLQSRMHGSDFKPGSASCQGHHAQKPGCDSTMLPAEKVDTFSEEYGIGAEDWSYEEHMHGVVVSVGECGAVEEMKPHGERLPWAVGELSRSLEGRKATNVRIAIMAIGALARGGLRRLSIKGGSMHIGREVTDSGLIAIGNCCAALRSLTLWDCDNIGDVGLTAIGNGCRLLEKLDLMKCSQLGDAGLQAVAKGCSALATLNLDSGVNIGNESLRAFGQHCGVLSAISISNCPMVGSAGISSITLGCKKLKTLRLVKVRLCNEGLAAIGQNCRSLTKVKFGNLGGCSEEGFLGFCGGPGLQQLRSLVISCCPDITDISLEMVGNSCKDLKLCALSQCQAVTDKGLEAFLQCCVCLESLQLEKCHSITYTGLFTALIHCEGKLKTLGLSKCNGVYSMGICATERPFTCLPLRTLQVRECKRVRNECVVMMGLCCPLLEHLDLSGLDDITDEGIVSILQKCGENLESLNLTKCKNITDASVCAVAAYCVDIRSLNLDGCYQIGDHSLQTLPWECNKLRELDVSGTSITDSGVQAIVNLLGMWLQSLTLRGCVRLTDKSLSSIENSCPSLGSLNLKNCPLLSSKAVSSLQSHLWFCDFECS